MLRPSDPRNLFQVTRKWIFGNRTTKGAWNASQLRFIGVAWPPKEGWVDRACGQLIPIESKLQFEKLSGNLQNKEALKYPQNQSLDKGRPFKTKSTGKYTPICVCNVLPWDDCEHTDNAANMAFTEIIGGHPRLI